MIELFTSDYQIRLGMVTCDCGLQYFYLKVCELGTSTSNTFVKNIHNVS